MKQRVNPERLNDAMNDKRLSVKALAKKASVSERTIARLRSGKESGGVRPRTIGAIAKALDIKLRILTGELLAQVADQTETPLGRSPAGSDSPEESRWNVRLRNVNRNAYGLVARRYGVPPAFIVEVAPLVFMLMAEQSLALRRCRLQEMREAYAARQELAEQSRHLPLNAAHDWSLNEIYDAEQSSIDDRDLFAEAVLEDKRLRTQTFHEDYNEDGENPFAAFLRALAGELGAHIEVDKVSRYRVEYELCRDHALALVDGDEALAGGILEGSLLLHELPSEFRRDQKKSARIEWFRQKQEWLRHKAAELEDAPHNGSAVSQEDAI